MKNKKNLLGMAIAMIGTGLPSVGNVVFQDTFTSGTITNEQNPYHGGWFSPQIAVTTWYGSHSNVSIGTGTLNVNSTSGVRSAGIFLPPSLFFGSGAYSLEFDVTAYSGDVNDSAFVSVWQGSNYDLFSSANALQLDTLNASATALGAASSSELIRGTYQTTGVDRTLNFNYDGSSGIALFFAANTGGYPFPTVSFDNVSLNKVALVPEPSTVTLIALFGSAFLIKRRRA
jgi:hypothetical protein